MNFIDFCAGIGGGRLGLTNIGFNCIGFSEVDISTIKTYRIMHTKHEINYGDITKIEPNFLPDFDLLISGFPCQSFSIIGERYGLLDEDKGQIIYHLSKIIDEKKPKYFILENVKGLINHDKGKTLRIILNILENIEYKVYYKVLNSIDFGVAQMRERVYFVGIRKDLFNGDFQFPNPSNEKVSLKDFLIDDNKSLIIDKNSQVFVSLTKYLNNKYNYGKYILKDLLSKEYLVLDTRQSDLRIYKNKVPTIRRGRQGILYVKNGNLRQLSGKEALLLQGFSLSQINKIDKIISNSQLLGFCGNAMTVNVIEAIGKKLKEYIAREKHMDLIEKGSQTAKNGFKNEEFVIKEFNDWENSKLAKLATRNEL